MKGDAATVEWLVRCAEEPATRWEGAFELLGPSEEEIRELAMKGYHHRPHVLSDAQRKRLVDALVGVEMHGYADLVLAEYLVEDPSEKITPALVRSLRKYLETDDFRLVVKMMTVLSRRLDSPDARAITRETNRAKWDDKERMRELTKQFLKLMDE